MRKPKANNRNERRKTGRLVVIILLAVVLMSAFLVFRCLTFDENGAHVIDRYGVLAAEGSSAGLVDYSQYANGSGASAATDDADSGKQEKKTTKKTQTSGTTASSLRAMTVSAEELVNDDTVYQQLLSLKAQGTLNAIIVDLKTSDGWLCTEVTTSAVDTSAVTAEYADGFSTRVAQMKKAGLRVIGRITCFRDDMATRQNSNLSCWYSSVGTNWLDENNHRWLDPTNSTAVQYLADIVTAGVSSGCDELVLDEFCFPTGQTDLISFAQPQEFRVALQTDLQQLLRAAGSVPVSLWMDTDVTTAAEQGQDLSVLYASFSRVFTTDASELAAQSDGGAKAVTVYTDRTVWSSATGAAVYDANGNIQ